MIPCLKYLVTSGILCLGLGLPVCSSGQGCLSEGIHFQSQKSIDDFAINYPGCIHIEGSLTIGESPQHPITSLRGLEQIQIISGALNISGNTLLKNLDGLHNLTELKASVRIANNGSLQDITALAAIDSVPGDLSISSNDRLSNLKGLKSLKNIGKHLIVNDNRSLSSLAGFENLQSIGRDLLVQSNHFLQSLEGLDQLHIIGAHVVIDANINLSTLKGLSKLSHIGGNLQVVNNLRLASIAGLSPLRFMGGLLQVYNNPFLKSLVGLDSISSEGMEDVAILFSSALSTCHVQSICDYLSDPSNQAAINNNALGCGSREEILSSCNRIPVNSTPHVRGKSVFFPNPTNGYLTVRGQILDNAHFATTDLAGRSIIKGAVIDNTLDLNALASGTYVVEVTSTLGTKRELVIKM